jgi:hypothetical protein
MNWILLLCMVLNDAPPAASDRPTVIVVVGAEGTPEYAQEFAQSADRWAVAAKRGSARFVQIGRDEPAATTTTDKDRLKALLDEEMKNPTQPLWLVFIGHGTSNGQEAKFNLRGPDVSDHELAQWLANCHRPLAFIDCSSASAPFINRLSGPGRVVITATQSGQEIQFSRFGDYLSASIADPAADLDKDGQTSLLEAFLAASHQVDEFYKQDGRIVTEHALLDDNGDGKGIAANWFQGLRATQAAKDGVALDGPRAHQWHLVLSAAEQAMPPELRARRDELELKIETLRNRKASLPEADYYAQLDELFLQLAKLYQQK